MADPHSDRLILTFCGQETAGAPEKVLGKVPVLMDRVGWRCGAARKKGWRQYCEEEYDARALSER
jgi:hypothetical protein